MKKQNYFVGTLTEAMEASRLPSWQRKQVVPRDREGRLVIHRETRDLFKEIARRNDTNMATAIWLAGYKFWHSLGYSQKDYDRIMTHRKKVA